MTANKILRLVYLSLSCERNHPAKS